MAKAVAKRKRAKPIKRGYSKNWEREFFRIWDEKQLAGERATMRSVWMELRIQGFESLALETVYGRQRPDDPRFDPAFAERLKEYRAHTLAEIEETLEAQLAAGAEPKIAYKVLQADPMTGHRWPTPTKKLEIEQHTTRHTIEERREIRVELRRFFKEQSQELFAKGGDDGNLPQLASDAADVGDSGADLGDDGRDRAEVVEVEAEVVEAVE